MLENETTQMLLRHINGGIREAVHCHPEIGVKPENIGSISKRVVAGFVGEIIEEARRSIKEVVTKEFEYQEIYKENEMLREKIDAIAKSNKHMLNKLKENNISL